MAVIETWLNQDLQKPVKVQYIDGSLFSNNGNGNRIGVVVTDNGEPVTISGTVSGYVVVSDGSTVPCTGAKSGNRASILIPPAAYVPGSAFISLFVTDGTTVTTLAAVSTTVLQTRTGTQVDPGSVVTDWTQTINGAMQDVQTAAANLGSIVATPYASLTYPVPLGKYTYYDGGLYRCISPIASSETFTPAHWTAVKLGDDVSDLKSAFNDATNNDILPVVQLGYINTGKSGTIDLTPMDTGGEYRHCIIECTEGDQFTISGTGGGQPRLWAFLNSSNVAITKADALATENKKLITAPEGTAKLIINNSDLSKNSYKGKLINEQVDVLNTSVPQVESFIYPQTENLFDVADYETNCYYDYHGAKQTLSSDAFGVSALIEIDVSKKYVFEGNTTNFSSGSIACVYFDASENFCGYFSPIIGSDELTQQVLGVTVKMPPYNAKYVAFTVSKTDLPNFKFYCAENVGIDHVTEYEYQQWNGKTWFAFGTSMSDTTFAMPYSLGGVSGKYPFYLTGLSGLIHHNYALGGSRITDSATADRDTILQKIQGATLTDVDLITIEGFVNDWAHGSAIGDVEDTTDATLYGALNLAIQSITSRNANTTIIILTDSTGKEWTAPGGTVYDNTTLNHKVNGLTQNDYNDAVVEYCNKVGIICIDAGRKSEISQYHPQYIADNLHHSQLGGKQYAFTIWDELKNIHPNRSN